MAASIENTAAHNLHSILDRVRQSGGGAITQGWAAALEASWGSPEFSKRHSETVNLLLLTIQQIEALPERSRTRTERYISHWWTAVMQPKINWNDPARPSSGIIGQDALDHLEATAEIISAHLQGTNAAPIGDDLTKLTEQCHEWLALLTELSEEEISTGLRSQLISQVGHLIWLIENRELFGGARISQESSNIVGSLFQAANEITTRPENTGRWRNGLWSLLAACAIFTQSALVVQDSIEAGTGLVKEIANTVAEIREE
ncbi:hypothetical protein [Streptomyces sp. KE1]|uniref:hypothetical protein n=1 Tax=Streptomyces sp. KE1 TaxID=1638939 RepID=UPI000A890EB0|nr:hypothetical protein [Streptomyces sp. KE1]